MGVGEIRRAKVVGERTREGRVTEHLPEPAVQASRFETRRARGVEPDEKILAVDDGEPGTRVRHPSSLTYEDEAGVHQFEGETCHGAQGLPGRWSAAPDCRWRINWLST